MTRTAQRWTEEEDALIRKADAAGRKRAEIQHLLPGRTAVAIQCRLTTLRHLRDRKCLVCGSRLPKPYATSRCIECIEQRVVYTKERKEALCRAAACTICKNPLDDDSSLTLCVSCQEKRAQYNPPKKSGPKALTFQGMVRWAGSHSRSAYTGLFPRGRRVVDLFGGSGAYTLLAAKEGFQVAAWNDLHSGLHSFITAVQEEKDLELWEHLNRLESLSPEKLAEEYLQGSSDPVELGALTYMAARASRSNSLRLLDLERAVPLPKRANFMRRMQESRKGLSGVRLLNLDYLDVIRAMDRPDTLFFCDPPYPKTYRYEHNLTGRHEELIDSLAALRGKFFLVLNSNRASGKLMARLQAAPGVSLYRRNFRVGGFFIRELVAVNYPLNSPEEKDLIPFSPKDFGL